MIVLAFDTETTGLIESRLKRTEFQPYVIQFCAWMVDLEKDELIYKFETYVKPPGAEFLESEGVKKSSKITWDMVKDCGDFATNAGMICNMIAEAPAVAAHNLVFDRDVIDLEMGRIGREVRWPDRQICTVETTAHMNGYRLSLADLHKTMTGEDFKDAHDARADVAALVRCLVEMYKRDWL
jgi:DNA polymerase III alpha subunit (gram-positive type)